MANKRMYTIIAEAKIPIKVKYTVSAETEQDAINLLKKGEYIDMSTEKPKVRFHNLDTISVFIYNSITRLLFVRLH